MMNSLYTVQTTLRQPVRDYIAAKSKQEAINFVKKKYKNFLIEKINIAGKVTITEATTIDLKV